MRRDDPLYIEEATAHHKRLLQEALRVEGLTLSPGKASQIETRGKKPTKVVKKPQPVSIKPSKPPKPPKPKKEPKPKKMRVVEIQGKGLPFHEAATGCKVPPNFSTVPAPTKMSPFLARLLTQPK